MSGAALYRVRVMFQIFRCLNQLFGIARQFAQPRFFPQFLSFLAHAIRMVLFSARHQKSRHPMHDPIHGYFDTYATLIIITALLIVLSINILHPR